MTETEAVTQEETLQQAAENRYQSVVWDPLQKKAEETASGVSRSLSSRRLENDYTYMRLVTAGTVFLFLLGVLCKVRSFRRQITA